MKEALLVLMAPFFGLAIVVLVVFGLHPLKAHAAGGVYIPCMSTLVVTKGDLAGLVEVCQNETGDVIHVSGYVRSSTPGVVAMCYQDKSGDHCVSPNPHANASGFGRNVKCVDFTVTGWSHPFPERIDFDNWDMNTTYATGLLTPYFNPFADFFLPKLC